MGMTISTCVNGLLHVVFFTIFSSILIHEMICLLETNHIVNMPATNHIINTMNMMNMMTQSPLTTPDMM